MKGNPMMRDREGQSVPPAVMNYANLALQMDPHGHGFEGDGDREHGVQRQIDVARALRNRPAPKDTGMTRGDVLEQERKTAKKHTREQMKNNPEYNDDPRYNILRLPRESRERPV